MTDLPETLKAFSEAAADMLANEIRGIRKEAERHEEIRALEHRAFMAETTAKVEGILREVEDIRASVKDGRDGIDADMDALKAHLDELVKAIPVPEVPYLGEVKGVFDPAGEYRAKDIVAFDGSSWIARKDNPGELPGDGWMLMAMRGKQGKPGKDATPPEGGE